MQSNEQVLYGSGDDSELVVVGQEGVLSIVFGLVGVEAA
jgi:hypothetical protein